MNMGPQNISYDDFFGEWVTPWWQQPVWLSLVVGVGAGLVGGVIYLLFRFLRKRRTPLACALKQLEAIDSRMIAPQLFYIKAMGMLKMILGGETLTERDIAQLLAQSSFSSTEMTQFQGLVERAASVKYDSAVVEKTQIEGDKVCLIAFLRGHLKKGTS